MNDAAREKHLNESHERMVRQAMFSATEDLIRRRKEKEKEEKRAIEARFERIEKRLDNLELTQK